MGVRVGVTVKYDFYRGRSLDDGSTYHIGELRAHAKKSREFRK
jgi:hypothetical protein